MIISAVAKAIAPPDPPSPIIIDINTEQYIDLNTIIELVHNYKLSDNIN